MDTVNLDDAKAQHIHELFKKKLEEAQKKANTAKVRLLPGLFGL